MTHWLYLYGYKSRIYCMVNDFLKRVREILDENLSNEKFGVSELAQKTGMSRSNLLRRIKKSTRLSASQFIRQERLKKSMELLKQTSLNVSEVSYEVGFSSTSYFIKCFRDYYGYPPGEVGKRGSLERDPERSSHAPGKRTVFWQGLKRVTGISPGWKIASYISFLVVIALILFYSVQRSTRLKAGPELEKSIAVLPFKNDSNDSTNIYFINGLMESVLSNLQKIEDLRVISRTSVEKYRNNPKTIPEIAEELNVSYFVEGSGQKIGDQILLYVQLIEASSDSHMWSEQYERRAFEIFSLQSEVAKSIADAIEAIITPEEEELINKVPTHDLVAYDHYLKGFDLLTSGGRENLEMAVKYFNQAIASDPEFALAYANLAHTYYFLDIFQAEKRFSVQINSNADKALLIDSRLPESLIAKAMFYLNNREYDQVVPYLEKALEYNPNSAEVINMLSDFYTNILPDTEKYLEYALKGIKLNIAAQDSVTASYTYLHISNALMQTGFTEEAERYVNRSLEFNPENLFSEYLRAYILHAKDRNIHRTKELLIAAYNKDSTRWDILQEIGKICYYMRDYQSAYQHYRKFLDVTWAQNLDVYQGEKAKIGLVLSEVGMNEESEKLFKEYRVYAVNDRSTYKHLSLAVYAAYHGESENAIENLRLFSQHTNYSQLLIPFLRIDPLVDNIKDHPEFQSILDGMENQYWKNHKQIRASLEESGLL